ncbi:RNA polymerase sigma-70 factor [Puteibacter caeruleilacunae]|nr:RNA polymerase sigma-70 factor [Puteibacter caeruleilacunae]
MKEVMKKENSVDFDGIFNAYYPRLLLFAIKMTRSKPHSEEIVQDVFVRFWMQGDYRKIKQSVKSYLFRSVFNACLDFQQAQSNKLGKREELTPESDVVEFHDPILAEELDNAIEMAIQQLPPRCREIFVMSRKQKMTYSEIAKSLDVSVKTVETQMSRAIKALKKSLVEYVPTVLF